MTPKLPATLRAGRQTAYFRYFFDQFTADPAAISDTDVAHYAAAYQDPDHLRAGFEFFRALPAAAADNAAHTAAIDVPMLLVAGEHLFGPIMPAIAEALRTEHGRHRSPDHRRREAPPRRGTARQGRRAHRAPRRDRLTGPVPDHPRLTCRVGR